MVKRVLDLYSEEGILAALAHLTAQESDIEVVKACGELITKLYWEEKDLPSVVAAALFGLSLGWKAAAAHQEGESEKAVEILSLTKAIAYNLASYTWPGWDEPGIQIGQTDLALGLAAAQTNVRLADELNKEYLPLARAHWMLGAHFIVQQDYAQADRNFALSAENATAVGAQAEVLLAEGFRVLVQSLQGIVQEPEAAAQMQEVKDKLLTLEGGSHFVEQLDTACRVFVSKSR